MSDYVRTKSIRYRIPQKQIEEIKRNIKEQNLYDTVIDILEEKYGIKEYCNGDRLNEFNINYGYNYKSKQSEYYLDYMLDYEYGASGEFENARFLTENEFIKYKELFNKYIQDIEPSDLRLVHYSYYNGCDAPAVYDFKEEL